MGGYFFWILGSALAGAFATELRGYGGRRFRWRRLVGSGTYRTVLGVAIGLAMSSVTNNWDLVLATAMGVNLVGVGEATLLKLIGGVLDDSKTDRHVD